MCIKSWAALASTSAARYRARLRGDLPDTPFLSRGPVFRSSLRKSRVGASTDSDLLRPRNSSELSGQDGSSVGQVPDLPSSTPTTPWQVGDLPHSGSCSFHTDSEMPRDLRRSETERQEVRLAALEGSDLRSQSRRHQPSLPVARQGDRFWPRMAGDARCGRTECRPLSDSDLGHAVLSCALRPRGLLPRVRTEDESDPWRLAPRSKGDANTTLPAGIQIAADQC